VALEELTMNSIVASLVHTFAPWQTMYANSKVVSEGVTALHLVAMLFGGGYAVAADRTVLRSRRTAPIDARRLLAEMHALHVPVVIALVVLTITGAAMAAADVETFASSPVFAAKLGIVVLLLVNGLLLLRAERKLDRFGHDAPAMDDSQIRQQRGLWRNLRATAWASAALWTVAVVVGVMLTNSA
jgi:uncharacterized membrane protein